MAKLWILLADLPPPDPLPNSRTGLYVAIAVGALVLLVGVALWRRRRAQREAS